MWTTENRARYNREHLRYPRDTTDEEWTEMASLIPPGRRGGRKRTVNVREVLNGLLYVLSTGCQWRAIPKELPPRSTIFDYFARWEAGVSSQGSLTQSVQVRPRPRDSGLVAREAPGRESQPVKPSDNTLCKERAQRSRLQRAVNAAVASLHASPVAEPVYYVRRQQGPGERSPQRRSSPAGYQR
jgi:transposase